MYKSFEEKNFLAPISEVTGMLTLMQMKIMKCLGARGGTVCRDTAIQAGRSRVQFPMCSFRYFIDLILTVGSTHLLTEMITKEYFLEGKDGQCVVLTTLPPLCAECLQNCRPRIRILIRTRIALPLAVMFIEAV
jgi:hypothetical protein